MLVVTTELNPIICLYKPGQHVTGTIVTIYLIIIRLFSIILDRMLDSQEHGKCFFQKNKYHIFLIGN